MTLFGISLLYSAVGTGVLESCVVDVAIAKRSDLAESRAEIWAEAGAVVRICAGALEPGSYPNSADHTR